MKKIIITGANGLLGKEMIALLKHRNINFLPLKSRIENLKESLDNIDRFKPDIFFHFGALKKIEQNKKSSEILFKSNVVLTNNLSNYCKNFNCKFVYISTADLYKRFGPPFPENASLSQNQQTITGGIYAWTKYLGEKEIVKTNNNAIIFRCSTIYNNKQPNAYSCARFFDSREDTKNFKFKKNQYQMNFVRADFLAKSIFNICMKKEKALKIYNFTSSVWFDNFDIINLFLGKFNLSPILNDKKTIFPKRFNGSNSHLRKDMGIAFRDSNYLEDLKIYLEKNSG